MLKPTHSPDRLLWMLSIILFFKIAGYFTVSESVLITRVFKVLVRSSMTGWLLLISASLSRQGMLPSFHYRNLIVPVLYAGYLFLGLASLLWSNNPGYSLLQLTMNTESFLFCFLFMRVIRLLQHYYGEEQIRLSQLLNRAIFGLLAIFVIGMYADPDTFFRLTRGGEEARLGGYLMNPNELGMLAVVGLGCCLLEWHYRRKLLPALLMGLPVFYALLVTGSRSSLVGFLLVVAWYVLFYSKPMVKVVMVLGGIVLLPVMVQTLIIKGGDVEEVLSMTGRLPFWTALLTEGLPKEPWFGFGYMRIAYGETFESVHTYAGKMTHNTFIQVLMNLGFVGFTIVCLQMATLVIAGIRSGTKRAGELFFVVATPILINSFTEFGIFGEANFGILFYQLLIFLFVIGYHERFSLPEQLQITKAISNTASSQTTETC